MDVDKTIELLNRKIKREKAARKAAEELLERKSHELYMAKQLVEDTLFTVQEKAEKDVVLLEFKSYIDSILLDYNQRLLKEQPTQMLLQSLINDLGCLNSIQSVRLSFSSNVNETLTQLYAGKHQEFETPSHASHSVQWNEGLTQITVFFELESIESGAIQLIFNTSPNDMWRDTIEKQFSLISEMINAAFERKYLLDKTLKEKKRAESSERATRDFVAMINHELRTPLNGLLGSAELMEDTQITDYQNKLLETIHQSGQMLRIIINDLLDFSKMSAGMLELKVANFKPCILVKTIEQIFTPQMAEKCLRFDIHIADNLPPELLGDIDRIQQILVNLIGNAFKFTKKGYISLQVGWQDKALLLIISDTGCGIPQDKQKFLFEPFTQVDNSSQRQFEGTGLGLSICKLLVDEMSGELSFKSELGKGSEFQVKLPLTVVYEQQMRSSEDNQLSFPIENLSILAVEDIKMNQVILNMMLKKLGITPDFANDGMEALTYLQDHEVDIVLMDCRMPILDGFETTKRLREQGYRKPILALTAGTTSIEVKACIDAGMDDTLSKPYKAAELEAMLKSWGAKNI
ncbi:ATP-binding protein [Aliivibrio fischeri]|uniref:ATP-binding protein n=1 Tax=Aliivibrio fischeri TaxID=668 RepID=UPI00031EE569|nr:ATP-binding protein [Aliivibrio fischeri]OCH04546.1 hybrid sensor histidine kinase/response regulator [Aliivibrio fischeri]OCH07127.1 hybrid sensor histidine kinase/response regulator [Aliivibrio fischeri]OEE09464.1 hybrid sensor histidine kinase/response regulator [Aliivibrio fischeri ZF-211]USR97637.1 ATP-binding protein [Aliivibrio fischeri ATCC 7744 = JCM 18803 = DSM 507]GGK36163.1 hybrid sensor histidine kinase/response regulator [Aliivibrio fischeri]